MHDKLLLKWVSVFYFCSIQNNLLSHSNYTFKQIYTTETNDSNIIYLYIILQLYVISTASICSMATGKLTFRIHARLEELHSIMYEMQTLGKLQRRWQLEDQPQSRYSLW